MEIERYLLDIGIKPHYKGFRYLTFAIELCQKNNEYLNNFTTRLYPDIAKYLNTTQGKVERCLRTAIKGSGICQTVSEFISRSTLELRLKNSIKSKSRRN